MNTSILYIKRMAEKKLIQTVQYTDETIDLFINNIRLIIEPVSFDFDGETLFDMGLLVLNKEESKWVEITTLNLLTLEKIESLITGIQFAQNYKEEQNA